MIHEQKFFHTTNILMFRMFAVTKTSKRIQYLLMNFISNPYLKILRLKVWQGSQINE